MRFEHPEWLLLTLLCVPMAVVGVRWLTSMSAVRRWTAVVFRTALIALITGMLAGATSVRHTDRLAVIAVVDVSGSVQRFAPGGKDRDGRRIPPLEVVRRFLVRASRDRAPDDLMGVVVFDGDCLAVVAPTRVDALDRSLDYSMKEGTDIAQALRLGAAMIPPDASGRLVLVSDGNQTAGDALAAAEELSHLAGRRVPIDVVPLAYYVTHEVMIESVDAPPQAQAESVVTVRVVLESTAPATGTLSLLREGRPVPIGENGAASRRLVLEQGRHVELINVTLPPGTTHRFEAVYEPDQTRLADGSTAPAGDTILSNNRAEAVTLTPGRGSVLVVDGVSDGDPTGPGATLPQTLREAGLDVFVVPSEGLPGDLLSLQAYDLVVLQNVPADAVSRTGQEALASYVSELGGGLVMIGGRSSFGAGGWKGTPIEPILPVRLDLPEKLIVPAAAIVIILDDSGSMHRTVMGSNRTQQQIADEGAAAAVMTLDRTDLVGVISFNMDYTVEQPLTKNRDPERTAQIIRSITPDGGTNLPPALEEARRQLNAVTADVKHVIVLSDGVSQGKDELPVMAEAMRSEGIHVTTIAVGDDADTRIMADMAQRGGGQFFRVTDPNVLPRVFIKAIRVVRSPLIRESPFTPEILPTGSPLVEGLSNPPPLRGLVLTQARPEPTITYAMVHPAGEPVLAHWNAGLGRVAAFTSDASTWARAWLDWPGYRQLWTSIARTIARPKSDRTQELTTEIVGDELRIRLDAASEDGKPLDLLTVGGSLYRPDGERAAITLSQTGPGVYEGSAPAPASGNYVVTLLPRMGSRTLSPVVGGVSRAAGVEYRRLKSNIGLLEEISRRTGGRVLDISAADDADLFDRSGVTPSEARLPLWRHLLVLSLVALLLDVGTRRIAWDRLFSREFGATLRREAAAGMRDRTADSIRTLESLRGRGARGIPGAIGPMAGARASVAPPLRSGYSVAPGGAAEPDQTGAEESILDAAPVAPAPLSIEDARQIVRENTERRRAAADTRGKADSSPGARSGADAELADGKTDAPTTGLFAAKERARRRLQGETPDGGD